MNSQKATNGWIPHNFDFVVIFGLTVMDVLTPILRHLDTWIQLILFTPISVFLPVVQFLLLPLP